MRDQRFWAWGHSVVDEACQSSSTHVHEVLCLRKNELSEAIRAKRPSEASREVLEKKCNHSKHQGVIADVELKVFSSVGEFSDLKRLEDWDVFLALDQVQDPQNLGSVMRSAHFLGARALIFTEDHASPLTGVVAKASAGAIFSLPLIRVKNLSQELRVMGKLGFWRMGLDASGQLLETKRLPYGPKVFVLGSEGLGLRELTEKNVDEVVSLPVRGHRDSLNVAVAGAIALYEVFRTSE